MIRSTKIVALMILLFCWQTSFGAGKIDFLKMKKDLNIMSSILDQLMNPQNDRYFGEQNTRAVYLEGQGVLFIYREKLNLNHIVISGDGDDFLADKYKIVPDELERKNRKAKKKSKDQHQESIWVSKHIEVSSQTSAQKLNDTKKILTEFLGDYCGAIKQLKPSDQVTVVVISENSTFFRLDQSGRLNQPQDSRQLAASISFADITSFRRKPVNQKLFSKQINFTSALPEQKIDKDLQIMGNIFKVALQQNKDSELVIGDDISGIYLQNFGALFILNFQRNFATKVLQVKTNYENLLSIINEEEEHFAKKGKMLQDEIKQNVVDVLADYGHNLRQLKDKEWIGVAVDLKQFPGMKEEASSIFFKVRKGDAVAVSLGKIKANKFRDRVVISTY